jgi:hypothetical protein
MSIPIPQQCSIQNCLQHPAAAMMSCAHHYPVRCLAICHFYELIVFLSRYVAVFRSVKSLIGEI